MVENISNIIMSGNIKEDYVSFELAKALHENGFTGESEWAYDVQTKEVLIDDKDYHKDFDKVEVYPMPTLNVARKWVQEAYKCFISVEQKNDYLSHEICTYYTYNIKRFDVVLGSGMESVYTSPHFYKKETDAIEHAIFYIFTKEKEKKIMEKYTLNFEIPLVIWVKNHIVPLKKIESIATKETVDFQGQYDWIAAWCSNEDDKEYNGFNSQDVTMETVWKNGSYWVTLTSNKPFTTIVTRHDKKNYTLKESIIIWLKGCLSDGIGENEIGQVTYNYEDYDVWMDELIEIKNKVKKGKKNLLSAFGDRYRVDEYKGSYILYDKEGHARRATMLFLGQFYLTDKKDGYIFHDKTYDTTEDLIDAMKAWGETLPFDVELYNPLYKPSYRIECGIHDYFKSIGFETDCLYRHNTFILKDVYGKEICSFNFTIDEDTSKGNVVFNINDGKWVQSDFTDLESAVGAVNTIIAPYCAILQSKFTQIFSKMTKARVNSLSTVKIDWSKFQCSSTNSIDSTIEMLENEIKLLKELKS